MLEFIEQLQNFTVLSSLWMRIIGYVLLILVITFFAQLIANKILSRLSSKAIIENHIWLNTTFFAIRAPIVLILWIIGISMALRLIEANSSADPLFGWIDTAQRVGIVFSFLLMLLRFIHRGENNFIQGRVNQKPINKTTALAIARLLRILVIIVGILAILQSIDVDITGFLALGGASTVVLGIAAQGLLANLFGGFMVFMDRPFVVGDWIRSPDKSIEGTVEYIGWRLTKILTLDKRPLYVPNSLFLTLVIENNTRMSNRRLKEVIGLRYQDLSKVSVITKEVQDLIDQHPKVDHNKLSYVAFNHFADSSINCQVSCFTATTDLREHLSIQQEILLKIYEIVTKHGADIAFPTTSIDLPNNLGLCMK